MISFIVFFLFDFVLRNAFIEYSIVDMYNPFTLCCVLIWCFILTLIASLLPKIFLKRIYLIAMGILSLVLLYGQTIYFYLFYKFFSFADLSLAEEGLQYADLSYFTLPIKIIAGGLILMAALILACLLMELSWIRRCQPVECLYLPVVCLWKLQRYDKSIADERFVSIHF